MVKAKLSKLKEAISGGTTQTIKDAMVALNQEVMQLGQSLYNQPGAPGAGPSPDGAPSADPSESSSGKGPEGDVIDADFTNSNLDLATSTEALRLRVACSTLFDRKVALKRYTKPPGLDHTITWAPGPNLAVMG
ncbi:stromal 70 kDa heat shock-related protein, chloroplastic-like protein, partial [Tanacetum coccineum]